MKRSRKKQQHWLHPDKLRFKTTEVPYVGHELTASGLKIDEHKVRAIRSMPAPTSVKEVRRFIGIPVFLPHMANVLQPLQPTHWKGRSMGPEHDSVINTVNQALLTAPIPVFFDKQMRNDLESTYGLVAVLLQEGRPIAFASRRLTKAEDGYAQIEPDLLAIVFGYKVSSTNTSLVASLWSIQINRLSTIAKEAYLMRPDGYCACFCNCSDMTCELNTCREG